LERKEALLRAIIEERSPLGLVKSVPPQVLTMPPEVFLRFLLPQILGIVEEERFVQLLRVIFPELVYNPQIAQVVTGFLQQVLGFLTPLFESWMEIGELRRADPALAAQVLLGSVFAFVLRRQILRDPLALRYTHEQIADAVIETLLMGLVPRE